MICVTYILQQIYGAMISMGTYLSLIHISVKKPSPKRKKEVDALLDPYLV